MAAAPYRILAVASFKTSMDSISSGDGGLGYNTSTLYVRGQHNNGTNTALVIIDGIERPIDDILPEEIESIEV